ncbi:hypothetical protein IEN85_21435 [Pelagicoccus sp. NFK12]|uniref:Uncharacterized protein n=1 Tax=Pelagicoccus enzymogenes TaxID=2773457 RepID=A0A927FE16_9BACT|nr:hypothetical protein [Pelagicoccus enzymogenes]MBD5782076.1 hypothetical protein [Pelagicoccus enzymogenes]MDQ8196830.1 hypothetical protein [Pelagicoccus enzymogenes]
MNDLKPSRPAFNPPLRIFSLAEANGALSSPSSSFKRPQLQRLVRHDRIARYFTRRGLSFGSPLD